MFINNINDKDLCLIIYKAGALLFPRYSRYFGDDLQEFQQECAYIVLSNLNKYNPKKGSISNYIYNNLPLLVSNYLRCSEGKSKLMNDNFMSLDELVSGKLSNDRDMDNYDCFLIDYDYNLVDEINEKEKLSTIRKILNEYPTLKLRFDNDLSFSELAKKLGTSVGCAKYRYITEIGNMLYKYEKTLNNFRPN